MELETGGCPGQHRRQEVVVLAHENRNSSYLPPKTRQLLTLDMSIWLVEAAASFFLLP